VTEDANEKKSRKRQADAAQSRMGRRTSRRRSGMLQCKHALHATTTPHFWLPPLPASKESSVKLLPIFFLHQLATPEKLLKENPRVAESLVFMKFGHDTKKLLEEG
jgi:hypothetical protein